MGHLIFCMESVSKLPYVFSMKSIYLQKLNKVESKKWEATPFHQAQNDKQKREWLQKISPKQPLHRLR